MRIATLENQLKEMGDKLNEVFSRQQTILDAPNAIESYVPGQHDPMERAKVPPVSSGQSSLGDIAGPRKRGPGRPSNASKMAESAA
jgi:hypothetical protein